MFSLAAVFRATLVILATPLVSGRACPLERGFEQPDYDMSAPDALITFRSTLHDGDVTLLWINEDGLEIPLGRLRPHRTSSFTTMVGHIFLARRELDGQLLVQDIVPASIDTQMKHVSVIRDCGQMYVDDEEHKITHGRRDSEALQDCPLSTLLSTHKVPGLHVMCFTGNSGQRPDHVCVFKDGMERSICSHSMQITGDESAADLVVALRALLRLKKKRTNSPDPNLFTASGRLIAGHQTLSDLGIPSYRRSLVLCEGGTWAWPPVYVGFTRPIHHLVEATGEEGRKGIALRTVSMRPRVFEVKHFLEEVEVRQVLEQAGPHVERSDVVLKDADHGREAEDWRTSRNYFLSSLDDEILMQLDERVQNLTRVPAGNSEHAQVLRYDYMGRYVAHHDYFDPKDYAKDPDILDMIGHGAYNRFATVFMYMSDVEEGGETIFPDHNGAHNHNFSQCEHGYKVKPEYRKVIIFYDMHPSGALDTESLHAGCRVMNGTKWSANYWIWNTHLGYKTSDEHGEMMVRLHTWDEAADRREEAEVWQLHLSTTATFDSQAPVKDDLEL